MAGVLSPKSQLALVTLPVEVFVSVTEDPKQTSLNVKSGVGKVATTTGFVVLLEHMPFSENAVSVAL
jgi:hypothetical protein